MLLTTTLSSSHARPRRGLFLFLLHRVVRGFCHCALKCSCACTHACVHLLRRGFKKGRDFGLGAPFGYAHKGSKRSFDEAATLHSCRFWALIQHFAA